MKQRHRVIPAVHLFLFKSNQVLLLRRFNTGYEDGNYSVPAGHVDGDETATYAMVREAQEEVGITFTEKDLEVVHVMHRRNVDENQERIDFFLVAKRWNGQPVICEPNKCDQLKWFNLNSLPTNIIPYVKFALQQVTAKQVYSEFGWR